MFRILKLQKKNVPVNNYHLKLHGENETVLYTVTLSTHNGVSHGGVSAGSEGV